MWRHGEAELSRPDEQRALTARRQRLPRDEVLRGAEMDQDPLVDEVPAVGGRQSGKGHGREGGVGHEIDRGHLRAEVSGERVPGEPAQPLSGREDVRLDT